MAAQSDIIMVYKGEIAQTLITFLHMETVAVAQINTVPQQFHREGWFAGAEIAVAADAEEGQFGEAGRQFFSIGRNPLYFRGTRLFCMGSYIASIHHWRYIDDSHHFHLLYG